MRVAIGEARRAYELLAPPLLRAGVLDERAALGLTFMCLQRGEYSMLLDARVRWPKDREIGVALEEARQALRRGAGDFGLLRSGRGHLAALTPSGEDLELRRIFTLGRRQLLLGRARRQRP